MKKKNSKKNIRPLRLTVQLLWAIITNSYVTGFTQGAIYQGSLKNICVPGLNCSSCPGAVASCPIGAIQSVIGGRKYKLALYAGGLVLMFGALLGRFICGWLCPFGLVQELMHLLPPKKKIQTFRGDRQLRWLKFSVLGLLVVLLTVIRHEPMFCKWLCPAGTLEAGIPLVSLNEQLAAQAGGLFIHKVVILIALLVLSVFIYRPFCRYLCPLGAIYSLLNPLSLYRYTVDDSACVHCGACSKACPMACNPETKPNDIECIRCGKCADVCPTGAIKTGFVLRPDSTAAKSGCGGNCASCASCTGDELK